MTNVAQLITTAKPKVIVKQKTKTIAKPKAIITPTTIKSAIKPIAKKPKIAVKLVPKPTENPYIN